MAKNFKNIFLSLGGVGFSRYAPGTLGSFISAILLFFLRYGIQNIYIRISVVLVVSVLIYAVSVKYIRDFRINGKFDHPWIIMDELLGMAIAGAPFLMVSGLSVWYLILGFIFFRLFDIFKFWPVSALDKINTPQYVMLDDVLAGIFAAVITVLIGIT